MLLAEAWSYLPFLALLLLSLLLFSVVFSLFSPLFFLTYVVSILLGKCKPTPVRNHARRPGPCLP